MSTKFTKSLCKNLCILLSKTTGFCLMSNRVVEDNLLMVLRILPVTLVAIDIAILNILEQTWKLCICGENSVH